MKTAPDSAYLRFARRENPGASEEAVRERAQRLQEAARAYVRRFAEWKYPTGSYRPI